MYSTLAYLYQQTHMVILLDASGTYNSIRYRPVYSKNLVASRGVDNVILIRFMNQEQKPVDITGLTFTFRVISQDGTQLLLSKELETVTASSGHTKLTLVESELDEIVAQRANYSITVDRNNLTESVYVDDNAGARGVLEIQDAAMPQFEASQTVTMAANPGTSTSVYSSEWEPGNYLQTVQYNLDAFEGVITVETSVNGSAPWYEVDSVEYTSATTASKYLNLSGWYNTVRLRVEYTAGEIDTIYVR